jgi:NADH-quinone oxidoreductase subunit E
MGNIETKPKTAAPPDAGAIINRVDKTLVSYPREKANLIPILQQVQLVLGYLPEEALRRIAWYVGVAECSVYGVATFYAQVRLLPLGKKVVRVCRGTACHVRGSSKVLDEMEKRLGIKAGETTADMEYTLETVACIGACALAPTMTIDNETFGKMTTKKVAEVLGGKSSQAS